MHPTTFAALFLPFALALCDPAQTVPAPDRSCTVHADCSGDQVCQGPDEPDVCGVAPLEECASDAECGDLFCHAIIDGCSPDGIGSQCEASCDETLCGQGFSCIADACVADLCTEGFTCPAHQKCDPSAITAESPIHERTHGCVNIVCSEDEVCLEGHVCVNGICQTGEGVCQLDQPPP